MSKKIDRAAQGPSWTEVVLGVILSFGLGVVLGAVLLIARPVVVARELPEEVDPKAVYYIEGSRDAGRARQATAKRAAFVQGQTVTVTEEELNALAATPPAPAAPTKAGEAPAAPAAETLAAGAPNFRIRDGEVQVAVPVTINAAGLAQKVIVQGRGGFAKEGDRFVFVPNKLLVGSCPVERVPGLAGYVKSRFLAAQPVPEDIATAWSKVTNVTVEGNALTIAQ